MTAALAEGSNEFAEWLEGLREFVRIQSVSADPSCAPQLLEAAEWICTRLREAGGTAEVQWRHERPLVRGHVPASRGADSAPTVLCYGHFDVQPAGDRAAWRTDPFDVVLEGEWLYGRGVADDKGQLWLLIHAVGRLAKAGELPVNVAFLCDGEEEVGGTSAAELVQEGLVEADAVVIFDVPMIARGLPMLVVGTRGLIHLAVEVKTGERDLHAGIFGGAALNAIDVLVEILGRLKGSGSHDAVADALSVGVEQPSANEVEAWALLPDGAAILEAEGALPAFDGAGGDFYRRTWAEPAVVVHGLAGGEASLQRSVLPTMARAMVSLRPVAGQDTAELTRAMSDLLQNHAPNGVDVRVELRATVPPGVTAVESEAVNAAVAAFETVMGGAPVLGRTGGNMPIFGALSDRGIPVLLTGFDVPGGGIHAANERFLVGHVELGTKVACELFRRLAGGRTAT